MATFRLLSGRHYTGKKNTLKKHTKGSYVVSDLELEQRFGSRKFRKISDENLDGKAAKRADPMRIPPPKPANDGLDAMTIDQLKKLADDDEIDISQCKTKADIIKRIRQPR